MMDEAQIKLIAAIRNGEPADVENAPIEASFLRALLLGFASVEAAGGCGTESCSSSCSAVTG